jgi:hypothetical protein
MLAWQRTRISILGVTQDDAHAIAPPTTISLPARVFAGERWTQAFHDEELPEGTTSRVVGRGVVRVAGRSLPAWEVISTSVTGGAHPGTEREQTWHSQALGLDLRFSISRRIGGTFPTGSRSAPGCSGVAPLR